MEACKDGILVLFQKLCGSVLTQVLEEDSSEEDSLLSSFKPPDYHPPSSKFKNAAWRQLLRSTFDLLLLRKWVWFGTWGAGMSPECRCLSHTYQLHRWGLHEEAQRLEEAVGSLLEEGCPLQEKDSILKFLVLLSSSSQDQPQPTPQRKRVSRSLDDSGVFCYESYPSSVFEQLPVVDTVGRLQSALTGNAELFECVPGSGFRGFFSSESLSREKAPRATTLFDGLTHATATDPNALLDLPNIPSQAELVTLLRGQESGDSGFHRMGYGRTDITPGGGWEVPEPPLLPSLSWDDPLPPRAWEGWDEGQDYLSESAHTSFQRASQLRVTRLSHLAGIAPPPGGHPPSNGVRQMITLLDALPSNFLQPLEDGDSVSRALAGVLSSLLVYCRAQLHNMADGHSDLQLQTTANRLLPLIRFLTELFPGTSKSLKGLSLLEALYSQAVRVQGTPHYPFLLALLRQAAAPYLHFVQRWVFVGQLDEGEEFGLHRDEEGLGKRDHRYWTEGYRVSASCTPPFLSQHASTILTSGKALNLLRLCSPMHPLCGHALQPPRLAIAISIQQLEAVGHQCQAYSSLVAVYASKSLEEKKQKELAREREAQVEALRVRQEARHALQRIRSVEEARLRDAQERKRSLHQELRQQMEAARALRMEREAEEQQADRERMDALTRREEALATRERELEEEARASLVSYYDELSRGAEQRRARAEWRAKRLELSGARLRLLQQEAERWRAEGRGREAFQGERGGGETESLQLGWSGVHDEGVSGESERVDIAGTGGEMLGSAAENSGEATGAGTAKSPGSGRPSAGRRGRQTWAESMVEGGGVGQEGRRTWVASLIEPGPTGGVPLAAGEGSAAPSQREEAPVGRLSAPEEGPGREEALAEEEDAHREDTPATTVSHSVPECHPTPDSIPDYHPTPDGTAHHAVPVMEGDDTGGKDTPAKTSPHSITAETRSRSTAAGEQRIARGVPSDPACSSPQPSPGEYRPLRKAVPGGDIHHSVVQEALYGRAGSPLYGRAGSPLYGGAGSPEEFSRCLSPRLVSSRGQTPPSVAQDILYGRKSPGMESGLAPGVEPRQPDGLGSTEPQSTAQSVLYRHSLQTSEAAGLEGLSPHWRSAHARAPPSVLQDILYPRDGGAPEAVRRSEDSLTPRLTSTRGQAPPSSAQTLMYPGRHSRGTEHSATSPPPTTGHTLTGTTEPLPPPFQPFQDSFPTMDLPPTGDILEGILGLPPPTPPIEPLPLSLLPLPTLLQHSVTLPILTQSRLVNQVLVEHFLSECRVSTHFTTLRRFLLLEDGEFGHTLTTGLFQELTFGSSWRRLYSPSFLNPLLSSALDASLHGHTPQAERLSFALRQKPSAVRTHSVEALECLEMRYKVDWPCNIVITPESIRKYNKVFQLLLQLKRASWALKDTFARLKKCEGLGEERLRKLQTHRHELQHFVNVMEGYLSNQLFYLSWGEFEAELAQRVGSLDDLIGAHQGFVNKAIFRCLLSKKARPVMGIIQGIFSSILEFSSQLSSSAANPQRSYRAMCDTHRRFREAAGLLIKVVSKLVQRGYQPHLEDFLLRLNFNGFYV